MVQKMTSRKTRLRPPDREGLRRFTRAHNPFQPPRFRWWHAVLTVFFIALIWGQQRAPGLFSDVARHVVGEWEFGILARVTVIYLSLYAMLLVRTLHPMTYGAMILTVVSVILRLAEVRITHDPLVLGAALILFGQALYAIRIITRQPELSSIEIKKVVP